MDQKIQEQMEALDKLGYKVREHPSKPLYKRLMCTFGYHDWVRLFTINGQQMTEDGRACDICHRHEAH